MDPKQKVSRKSYTAEFKLLVCRRAALIGNRSAAREFSISKANVRLWRKSELTLSKMKKKRRSLRKKLPKWPDLERELSRWIRDTRNLKARVTGTSVRLHARALAQLKGITDFSASDGWYDRFMKRNKFSIRCRTSVGQPLPEDWLEKLEIFRAYVAEKKALGSISPKNMFNMDEVPCQFDLPGTRTIAETGQKDVTMVTTGSEKKSFTVILAVSAEGEKLIPMVIFKRKTIPKEIFPAGILVRANEKGWVNTEIMEDWMANVFNKRKSAFFKKPAKVESLLIYDACTAHLTPEVKEVVQRHTELAVIPGGLTKFLQPLDLSVNKSFKSKLRVFWDDWMLDSTKVSMTKGGNRRKATFATVCEWIVKAWKDITIPVIQNGFKKGGLHTYNVDADLEDTDEDDDEPNSSGEHEEPMEIDEDTDDDMLGDLFDGFDELALE